MGVKVKVDTNLLKVKIRTLLAKTKKTEKEFVREQASLMAETIVRATPPFVNYTPFKGSMGTKADFKKGRSAVIGDMLRVFTIRDEFFIKYLLKRFKREENIKGYIHTARGKLEIESPLVTLNTAKARKFYESKRLANGRPTFKNSGNRWKGEAIVSKKIFDTILKDKIYNLGIAKASFAKAVVKLNPKKRVNKWIKEHFGKVNTSITEKKTKGYSVVIQAKAKGLQYVTNKINGFAKFRIVLAEKRLRMQYRKMIRKSGFKR